MLTILKKLWTDESGATAVEYALMAAAIAAVIITIVFAVGVKVNGYFSDYDAQLGAH